MIMRFANLLGALFGGMCPLYRHLIELIANVKDYSRTAREAMTEQAKASILWVILVQARHFAKGETTIKPEFSNLKNCLQRKDADFRYGMVPKNLISERKRKGEELETESKLKKIPARTENNPNTWNPKLRAALSTPLLRGKNPSLTKICRYCNIPATVLAGNKAVCRSNLVLGKCRLGSNCKFSHTMATDTEADSILSLLEKFIHNPEGILSREQGKK